MIVALLSVELHVPEARSLSVRKGMKVQLLRTVQLGRRHESTIREIMESYIGEGVIPIVNENDMINKEEVEFKPVFTDNDILAALVAVRVEAELLLIPAATAGSVY